MNGTTLNLHIDLSWRYGTTHGTEVSDISDPTFQSNLQTSIKNLLLQFPTQIQGISFDDFGMGANQYDVTEISSQNQILRNIAIQTKNTIKGVNPNTLFSGSILWDNPAIYTYGDILDFTIAEIYNTNFNVRPDWTISKVIDANTKIPYNNLVIALFTFDTNQDFTSRPVSDIQGDINAVLSTLANGYMMYIYPFAPNSGLNFPTPITKTFNSKTFSNKIITVNKNPNLIPSQFANPTSTTGISVYGSHGQITTTFDNGVKLTSNYNGNQNFQLFAVNGLNLTLQPNALYNAMMELKFSPDIMYGSSYTELYLEYYDSLGHELGSYANVIYPKNEYQTINVIGKCPVGTSKVNIYCVVPNAQNNSFVEYKSASLTTFKTI
jgi:hypothetical protein